jgi:Holliday junction resolvase RusA-like endonuclease
MNALSFTVPGTPVAKGRARSFIRAGHVAHYTPEKTARYENLVKLAGCDAMAGHSPMQGALSLVCTFWMPVPTSYSKKRTADCLAGRELPAKKPDTDNMLKAIKDGCNTVVWGDDCQVVDVTASKRYGDNPRAEIYVCEANHGNA